MTALYLTVNVPDVDTTLVDPEDTASEIVAIFNEWAQANGAGTADLIEAEWD
jgi:hypothetical protein